jgi:glucan phosphoethanolaminetransferase (alkaline phosphatase superfamily)
MKAKTEEKKSNILEGLVDYLKSDGIETVLNLKGDKRKKRRAKKPMDANRKKVLQVITKMRSKGETFDKIALYLEKEKLQTFSNRGQWHAQTVHRLYQDHILP